MYIELHARSAFSFLEGAALPEELVDACADAGMPAMALLDRNGVYGAPRFHLAAKKAGVRAHIGSEVTVQDSYSPRRHPSTSLRAGFGHGGGPRDERQPRISRIRIARAHALAEECRRLKPARDS